MKKIKGSKKDKPDLPETVGGVTGEEVVVEEYLSAVQFLGYL